MTVHPKAADLLVWSAVLIASVGLPVAGGEASPFVEVARARGLDFVHWNGMTGALYFPEMTGQGLGFVDYDGDGDLDVYLVQGAMLAPGKSPADSLVPPPRPLPPRDRLFRNDLVRLPDGSVVAHFVDVTERAEIDARGYGMGVAVGDYDGDGFPDLYVTDYGPNRLLHNDGDGTFTDVTRASGTDDPRWSVSATFFDYDGDGRLDLYVGNYVAYDIADPPRCFAASSRPDYCGPASFRPVPDRLFHNRGDGTFEDVSAASHITSEVGPGLGVVAADLDGDGRTDVYVANDGAANFLWHNRGDGTFEDVALLAGVAVNRMGQAEASMGVTVGDFDGDGDEDLFMTHLAGEKDTLYINDGGGLFEDRSVETGLAAASFVPTSFGTSFFDYDNDGRLDLLAANGAVHVEEKLAAAGDPYPLGQPNQLFHNEGGRRFRDVSDRMPAIFRATEVSRGAAFGDIDDDGDVDVAIANSNGPVRLYENQAGDEAPWIGFVLRGPPGGRDQPGTRVSVLRPREPPRVRLCHTDGSFASASDPRVLVGLGGGNGPISVRVRWPGGAEEEHVDLPPRTYLALRRAGRGGSPE